ncbi:MAG: DUF6491 family protein [Rhodanobacteraceae bacterium]
MKIARFGLAKIATLGLIGITAAAAAQSPVQRDAANLARFERYAGAPQDSLHYFRTDGFQYLGRDASGNDAVAIWTGVNDVYLFKLQAPCIDLQYANAIGLKSTLGNVNARMDYIKYGRGRECRIETIRKVDYKAMKAEKIRGIDYPTAQEHGQ